MSSDGLKYAYNKIATFLKFNENQKYGITLIVSPVWMFCGFINKPYHVDPQTEIPLYLDGFAYAGIFNL